jgi:uncharacterized NAD(P)/FAD-binding protein YdhS
MTDRPTVAVIGAGFSGVLTALRLLLAPEGPKVLLVERGPRFGRGAAFATENPRHLLNVRATNMSAFVEQPSHFLEWLGKASTDAPDQVFVTRDRYGQYLQSLLRRATTDGRAAGRLVLEHDEALSLARDGDGWRIGLAMGRSLVADAVVLALGNLSPLAPPGLDPALIGSPHYVPDPWAWDKAALPAPGDILLMGTGLTAIDTALSINEIQPEARILAVSRHGLSPRRHAEIVVRDNFTAPPRGSPGAVLAQVRARSALDWRAAIDGLRPYVQTIWRGWTLEEKSRFLRHLRPFWDAHRHRLAPEVADRIELMRASGLFATAAGRIARLSAASGGVEVAWTPKGADEARIDTFALVVNCVGPREDLTNTTDPLIADLLASGEIRADACRLGLDVDARSRVIGADGVARETLFAVGPITRGQFYEIASVPDIRIQAADCAGALINTLAMRVKPVARASDDSERVIADLAFFLKESMEELDAELGELKFTRRVRNAWEMRGRRKAFDEIALWLEERTAKTRSSR